MGVVIFVGARCSCKHAARRARELCKKRKECFLRSESNMAIHSAKYSGIS